MNRRLFAVVLVLPLTAGQAHAQQREPIIDMHLHASPADANGPPPLGLCLPLTSHLSPLDPGRDSFRLTSDDPPCPDPVWSPLTDREVMEQTIAVMERRNIIGVLSGTPDRVLRWSAAAPDRFIRAVELEFDEQQIPPDSMRHLFQGRHFAVLGEVESQYQGMAPDDERLAPYWALAEELDIPVAYHMGEGPPGVAYMIPPYRARLTNPYLFEEVLHRHPRLRVAVMHYASPRVEEMIAMLGAYPQLYVDLGGIQWNYPREYFYRQLRMLIEAGFAKRVMFGSDQMIWPDVIERSLSIIEEAPFLSAEQKRDILYNNAARFLRLSDEEIARHHAGDR